MIMYTHLIVNKKVGEIMDSENSNEMTLNEKKGKLHDKMYYLAMAVFLLYVVLSFARSLKHTVSAFPYFFNPGELTFSEWGNTFWYLLDTALTVAFAIFLILFFVKYFKKQSSRKFFVWFFALMLADMVIDKTILVANIVPFFTMVLPDADSQTISDFVKSVVTPANILSIVSLVFLIILAFNLRKKKSRRLLNISMILLLASIICGMVWAIYYDSASYIPAIKEGTMTTFRYLKRLAIDICFGIGASVLPGVLLVFNSGNDFNTYEKEENA